MPGPLGILDELTPEKQEELFDLLEHLTTREVLAKIAAPPPEGWGLNTHVTSLRRFYQRKQLDLLRAEIEERSSLGLVTFSETVLKHEAFSALLQKTLYSSFAPSGDRKRLAQAFKFVLELEKLDYQRQRLKLDKEKMELEKIKQQVHAVLKSVKMADVLATDQFDKVLKDLNAMLDNGMLTTDSSL